MSVSLAFQFFTKSIELSYYTEVLARILAFLQDLQYLPGLQSLNVDLRARITLVAFRPSVEKE